jgi:hypothetical protein
MESMPPTPDPLDLNPDWPCPIPLLSLEEALEQSVFRSGLSRQEWLKRLARSFDKPALLPLLWLLPRDWRLAPPELPAHLQTLAGVVERGLLTPTVVAALADDLPHLLPATAERMPSAVDLWANREGPAIPAELAALLALPPPEPAPHPAASAAGRGSTISIAPGRTIAITARSTTSASPTGANGSQPP